MHDASAGVVLALYQRRSQIAVVALHTANLKMQLTWRIIHPESSGGGCVMGNVLHG
jgi:hypothetical protein